MKKLSVRWFCCRYSCFPVSGPPGWGLCSCLDHRCFPQEHSWKTQFKTFKVSFGLERVFGRKEVLVLTWSCYCWVGGSVSCSSHWCLMEQRPAGCDQDTIPPWSCTSRKTTRVRFRLHPVCCRRGRGTLNRGPCVQKRKLQRRWN